MSNSDFLQSKWAPLRRGAIVIGLSVAMSLTVLLVLSMHFGSVNAGVAYLRGEPCIVNPTSVSLGPRTAGSVVDVPFQITNLTTKSGNVSGASSSCECVATRDLPKSLPAGRSTVVTVHLKVPQQDGSFEQSIVFYADLGRQVPLLATIAGKSQTSE